MRYLGGHALRGFQTLAAAGLLASTALMAAGASAQAASHPASQAPKACAPQLNGGARVGRFAGIVQAEPTGTGCLAQRARGLVKRAGDPANGTPPLLFHLGPVMGTQATGPVVVTPIFWNPAGNPIAAAYKNVIDTYLSGVAADSGRGGNVFSTLNEYFGNNGQIRYQVRFGQPINDTSSLPPSGCTVTSKDTANIYADNSGYNACLDDNQVIAETDNVVTARHLPRNLGHIYVMFLPKHVESCFFAGSTTTSANACTINYEPSAAFCAYHSQAPSGAVYADLAFPIYNSPVGFTCGSDARFAAVQTPNGNADADTEVSPTSHEIMEAITDPDTATGWYDSSGFENGDECAYVYGATQGTPGQLFNQVIGHHHYLTQEEFSNLDFARTGGGCLQSGV
jgi:hypothetical protein